MTPTGPGRSQAAAWRKGKRKSVVLLPREVPAIPLPTSQPPGPWLATAPLGRGFLSTVTQRPAGLTMSSAPVLAGVQEPESHRVWGGALC